MLLRCIEIELEINFENFKEFLTAILRVIEKTETEHAGKKEITEFEFKL